MKATRSMLSAQGPTMRVLYHKKVRGFPNLLRAAVNYLTISYYDGPSDQPLIPLKLIAT